MNYHQLIDIHNVIVNTIKNDLLTVGEIDDHDPLGIAFFVYAILKAGFNIQFETFPEAAIMWVEEKVSSGNLSVYKDRDLAAIGLLIYSFNKYSYKPDINIKDMINLVEPNLIRNQGIYNNFLVTVLVGLGIGEYERSSPIYIDISGYIEDQIINNSDVIFNDPKNVLGAYFWAKENNAEEIINKIISYCSLQISTREKNKRDYIYLSYVMLEEAKTIPYSERRKIKDIVEHSLRYIQTYSMQSGFPKDIIEEYSEDAALYSSVEKIHEFEKPRLSRIALSIGLLLEEKYQLEAVSLFSKNYRTLSVLRGIVYGIISLGLLVLVIWFGNNLGFPPNIKPLIGSKDYLQILFAVFVLLGNILWITLVLFLFICFINFPYELALTGKKTNEIEVLRGIWAFLIQHWKIDVSLVIALGIFTSI